MVRRRRGFQSRKKSTLSFARRKENRQKQFLMIGTISASILLLAAIIYISAGRIQAKTDDKNKTELAAIGTQQTTVSPSEQQIDEKEEKAKKEQAFREYVWSIEPDFEFATFTGTSTCVETGDPLLDEAYRLALGYDYDGAISLIQSVTGYGNIEAYTNAIAEFKTKRIATTAFTINNNITHIFFHSLIVNPSLAFDSNVSGAKATEYNESMTTVKEFVNMMESLYNSGYVLVDIYDIAKMETNPNGEQVMMYQSIYLPEGKKPFVLSIDDTNYYEYMSGQGFASKLVIDENGEVANEYTLVNGETIVGPFDVISILEDFIEYYPDFSYRGARGISGITGYNGVLGYRTSDFWYNDNCTYYESNETNDLYKKTEISGNNVNIEADKETAKKVAEAIKEMGWHFASHSWGHKRLGQVAIETVVWDSDMWEREVESILGETDILIFPYGNDIGPAVGWHKYEQDGPNLRYQTLKSYGFNYFLNVDSAVYFMQRTDDYFRMGRRNLDGIRMWQAIFADRGDTNYKNRLSDLFDDVSKLIDPLRPEYNSEYSH